MSLQLTATRVALRGGERSAPGVGAALAERLFFTPPRTTLTPPIRDVLAAGRRFHVTVDDARVAAWTWGHGPAVALVHGWGGRGGRLAATFVEPLVASGCSVVTFDAPGHGASEGKLSSMPQVARALRAIADATGSIHAILAHSMGGSASTLAMSGGLQVERAVFIAPAADPARFAAEFANTLGLSPAALARMQRRSEARLRFRWSDLNVPRMAARLSAPLLVLHDRDDATVPWEEGAEIAAAWPGAVLVTTTGLGHREIVHDPGVVAKAVAFITRLISI
jgi:pimeloyl-ACP methyl ester carboxylesterase